MISRTMFPAQRVLTNGACKHAPYSLEKVGRPSAQTGYHKLTKKSLAALMDHLLYWSADNEQVEVEVSNRPFDNYISWKIPFPMAFLESPEKYLGVRAFCIQRMIYKSIFVAKSLEGIEGYDFCRVYCLLTWPNLFGSEIGVAFSSQKWDSISSRNIENEFYREHIVSCADDVKNYFGHVIIPSDFKNFFLLHTVEDQTESIFFQGRILLIWRDVTPKHS